MSYKQAIVVRNELKMSKGKLAAQVAHASLEAALKAEKKMLYEWRKQGAKKVVLKVNTLRELAGYKKKAESKGLPTALIKDKANTFFKRPTTTCLAIGPSKEEHIDEITSHLKLL